MDILRLPVVVKKTGLSRTTIWRMMKRGEFPQPVDLGSRARGWVSSEITGWIENRIAARDRKKGTNGQPARRPE